MHVNIYQGEWLFVFVLFIIISLYTLPDRGLFLKTIRKLILKFPSYDGLFFQGVSCGRSCAPFGCTETVVRQVLPSTGGGIDDRWAKGPLGLCSVSPKAVSLLPGILGSRGLLTPIRGHLKLSLGGFVLIGYKRGRGSVPKNKAGSQLMCATCWQIAMPPVQMRWNRCANGHGKSPGLPKPSFSCNSQQFLKASQLFPMLLFLFWMGKGERAHEQYQM